MIHAILVLAAIPVLLAAFGIIFADLCSILAQGKADRP